MKKFIILLLVLVSSVYAQTLLHDTTYVIERNKACKLIIDSVDARQDEMIERLERLNLEKHPE